MKRIMLIDDDSHEAIFWKYIIDTNYSDQIALECYTEVESALDALDEFQPDAVLLDNNVPPHENAQFGLKELRDRNYTGEIFVWSFTEKPVLDQCLKDWPHIETIAKQDYIGLKVRDLIESKLMAEAC